MVKDGAIDNKRIEKICINCGISFSIPRCRDWREHCCSSNCKKEAKLKLKDERKKECLVCGKEFYPRVSQIKSGEGNYCSTRCFYDSRIGLKNSVETKEKRIKSFINSDYNKNRPTGRRHPQFKEAFIRDGYRYITDENGKKIAEHRHVMEIHIGRKLKSHEVAHHKDRNKLNNEINNLQLMTRAEHAKEHANDNDRKTCKGTKMSDEHKEKLRKVNKGKKFSKESILKRIESRKRNKERKNIE